MELVIGKEILYDKIILIQEFFLPKDEDRFKELQICLQFNIDNKLIDEIHLFMEEDFSYDFLNNQKIKKILNNKRLTFKRAFDYANKLDDKIIKIVSNNDISFELESLEKVKKINLDNCCLALTRYDVTSYDPFTYKFLYTPYELKRRKFTSNSQDTWIFNKIKTNKNMDFFFGLISCDNYIAFLINEEKVNIVNNSLTIKTFHHHLSQKRYYSGVSIVKRHKRLELKVVSTPEVNVENIT